MRIVKPRVFLAVVVVAGIVASAAFAGLRSGAAGAGTPRLTIPSTAPLVVVGQRFGAGERISVTVHIGVAEAKKAITANRQGRFTVSFRTATPCSPIYVVAKGGNGSRAAARRQVIPAPCGVDPTPGARD